MKKIQTVALLFMAAFLFTNCGDDEMPVEPVVPNISIADVTQTEGNTDSDMEFTVTLDKASTTNVLVSYATVAGTALATADFIKVDDGELIIAPGELTKTISIRLRGDEINENDETFEVLLFNPSNALLADERATGTIQNDDSGGNELDIPTSGYTTPDSYDGMSLVWSDEFTEAQLNSSNWTHELGTGNGGWGNQELQYYRSENTYMAEADYMIIEAREEAFGGSDYTSSRMVTQDKKEFQYGRIDIRAVLPEGQGIWPALWMLGENFNTTGWPMCGEIDIMELVGNQPNRTHATVHYGASFADHGQAGASRALTGGAKFIDEFHVFSLIWEEDHIQFLLDDVVIHEVTPATTAGDGEPYPFNQPFFFIFNVAVGGEWPGSPDGTTVFPQRMIVDYVRVFQ